MINILFIWVFYFDLNSKSNFELCSNINLFTNSDLFSYL